MSSYLFGAHDQLASTSSYQQQCNSLGHNWSNQVTATIDCSQYVSQYPISTSDIVQPTHSNPSSSSAPSNVTVQSSQYSGNGQRDLADTSRMNYDLPLSPSLPPLSPFSIESLLSEDNSLLSQPGPSSSHDTNGQCHLTNYDLPTSRSLPPPTPSSFSMENLFAEDNSLPSLPALGSRYTNEQSHLTGTSCTNFNSPASPSLPPLSPFSIESLFPEGNSLSSQPASDGYSSNGQSYLTDTSRTNYDLPTSPTLPPLSPFSIEGLFSEDNCFLPQPAPTQQISSPNPSDSVNPTLTTNTSHAEQPPVPSSSIPTSLGPTALFEVNNHQKQDTKRSAVNPNNKRRYVCRIPGCGKAYANIWYLKEHASKHLVKKPQPQHVCHIPGCGKAYTRAPDLREHVIKHLNVTTFSCDFPSCGKSFLHKHAFRRHMKIHYGEKKFTCHLCQKKFLRSDQLSKHGKSHRN